MTETSSVVLKHISSGHTQEILDFFLIFNPQFTEITWNTFLRYAAKYNHRKLVEFFLGHTNINYIYEDGFTALHWEAYNNNENAVKYLLANGADPSKRTTVNGHTALDKAISRESYSTKRVLEQYNNDPHSLSSFVVPPFDPKSHTIAKLPPIPFHKNEYRCLAGFEILSLDNILQIFQYIPLLQFYKSTQVNKSWRITLGRHIRSDVEKIVLKLNQTIDREPEYDDIYAVQLRVDDVSPYWLDFKKGGYFSQEVEQGAMYALKQISDYSSRSKLHPLSLKFMVKVFLFCFYSDPWDKNNSATYSTITKLESYYTSTKKQYKVLYRHDYNQFEWVIPFHPCSREGLILSGDAINDYYTF